jgi:outer membrane protein OmpA-like peptidoglycan-associated protein/flagellar hook assembly protein FlgD
MKEQQERKRSGRYRLPFLMIVVLAMVAGTAFGYNPPAGGEEWNDIVSPTFLGGRMDVTDTTAIMGDAVNPAVSGLKERLTAAAYYAVVVGPRGEGHPPAGHIGALDADLPTRIGVLGANVAYIDGRLPSLDFGRVARARLIYARDLFPRLSIGAGANLTVGSADRFFLSIAGDIGFLHMPQRFLGLDSFRWGFVFQNLGMGYKPHLEDEDGRSITGFPSILTPAAGFSFDVYRSEQLAVRLAADVSTPRFQNVRTGGSVRVQYRDLVSATLGTRYDSYQWRIDNPSERRGLIPSFGVHVNLTQLIQHLEERDEGSFTEESGAQISVAPLTGGTVAIGFAGRVPIGRADRTPPEISMDYDEGSYISPNNDGRSDDLVFGIEIEDEGLIKGYELRIESDDGNTVRRIENKDERPEIRFDSLVQEIREGETGILIPERLRWDGRADDGSRVSDGPYRFYMESWDDKGNRGSSSVYTVVVDTERPTLTVKEPSDLVFSPNGDGNKDTIEISQSGSAEQQIAGKIVTSDGTVVKRLDWSEKPPETFVWDGTDESGQPAPDGVYSYEVRSVDRAGNRTVEALSNIILNTETQSVFVTTSTDGFSPNGDGEQDTVTFSLVVAETDGLESWTFEIENEDGVAVRTYSGGEAPTPSVRWNGTDEDGNRRDGTYRGVLSATYRNGGKPSSKSTPVLLDTSAPAVNIEPTPIPFSPDNDGVSDDLYIGIDVSDSSAVEDWSLTITDPRDEVFKTFRGRGAPRSRLIWNGLSDDGELVQAAEDYAYVFEIADVRGNATQATGTIPVDVLVIREDGKLKIRISNITFAPNSPEYVTEDVDRFEKNIEILNRIAEILAKYDSYDVRIEGHAVNITGTEKEQREELVPLSRSRAETVRRSLVERGLDADRFSVLGVGGTDPIVPHTDLENRWKNRRVEFVLIR